MSTTAKRRYTTGDVARLTGTQSQSIAQRIRRHGDYFGIRPLRLPSGRYAWDAAEVEALLSGQRDQESAA